MTVLDGPGFDASRLDPRIRDFYEHTAAWHMEIWTGWSPLFRPAGELIARLFGRRVEQLSLPMRPLDVAHGMESQVRDPRPGRRAGSPARHGRACTSRSHSSPATCRCS